MKIPTNLDYYHRTDEAILYEVLLKSGIDYALANPEIIAETISEQKVYIAYGTAYYVIGDSHSSELFEEIAKRKPTRVVASEKGFTGRDDLKANVLTLFRQMSDDPKFKFEVF